MDQYDAIVIGAGAAGLMCALRAGMRGRKVLLLEHADQIGSKILISGGGRCNFTNLHIKPECYLSQNPHFCLSALKSYTQHDFIALVEKHKIAYHEKTLGQLFCDRSAQDILAMLLDECRSVNVTLKTNQTVTNISRNDYFHIQTQDKIFQSSSLVIATGGLSIPKMGATGFAYQTAKQFRVPLIDTRPALVPLVFDKQDLEFMRKLSGVSLEVIASIGKKEFREKMVFTHRGLSGPAILQISSYWAEGAEVALDLVPSLDAEAHLADRKKTRPKAELKTIIGEVLPQRFAQSLTEAHFSSEPINTLPQKTLREVAALLKKWRLKPSGSEGYAKAEVTLGGVSTEALSSKTMQSQAVPGLFFIGEAVDVTGWLGGYNFQWAWSSGWAAGSAL